MLNNNNKQKLTQHHSSIKSGAGFTLIELLVALSVFTIGILAILSLTFSSYNYSRDNLDKSIAANLAREGIELIRNVRDSNWLRVEANEYACGVSEGELCTWDNMSVDFGSNDGFVYIDYNDDFPTKFSCNTGLGTLSTCLVDCVDCKLYKDTDGYYNHDDQATATKYSRGFKLYRICLDESENDPLILTAESEERLRDINDICDPGPNNDIHIGIQVVSRVEWDEGKQSVEIVDKLYNWRR